MGEAIAASLGIDKPYGAIFDQPEPIVSVMSPGTQIYLQTLRDGQLIMRRLTLGSTPCRKSEGMRGRSTAA